MIFPDECYAGLAMYDAGLAIGNFMTPEDWDWEITDCGGSCLEETPIPADSEFRAIKLAAGKRLAKPFIIKDPLILVTNGWKMRARMQVDEAGDHGFCVDPQPEERYCVRVTQGTNRCYPYQARCYRCHAVATTPTRLGATPTPL